MQLTYANPPPPRAAARAATLFTVLVVLAVLGSGSVAWALLLMGHR